MTRPLDGRRQLTLVLGRDAGEATRKNLALVAEVPFERLGVLVVDELDTGLLERALGLLVTSARRGGAGNGLCLLMGGWRTWRLRVMLGAEDCPKPSGSRAGTTGTATGGVSRRKSIHLRNFGESYHVSPR